nr:unnamed protein product [Callosobruchus chinensis]
MRLITGTIRSTLSYWLPLLSNIYPPAIRRTEALLREHRKIRYNPDLPVQEDIPALRRNRLRSRKPPLWHAEQSAANNVEIRDLWDHHCRHTVNPEERECFERYSFDTAGMELDRKLWVSLNRARTGHGRCADSLYKWGAAESPRCDCVAPRQTVRHITGECPVRSFQGRWNDLMKADNTTLAWIRNLDINI